MRIFKWLCLLFVLSAIPSKLKAVEQATGQIAKTNPKASANSVPKLTPEEKYKILQSSVAYWFDYTTEEDDSDQWDKITKALSKTTYGENEFEVARDKENVASRLAEIKKQVYGIKVKIRFPEYNFTSKTYSFSGALPLEKMEGKFINKNINFSPLKINSSKAEEIHTLNNENGYYQEIIFKPVRIETQAEASAYVENDIRAALAMTGESMSSYLQMSIRNATPASLFQILASKITIEGYGDIYNK